MKAAERAWDKALGIQTAGREDERGGRYMPYEPTPYAVLARLAESGWVGPGNHVLDYGTPKGRAVFFLADRIGCRATGIDHSEKLVVIAGENRARFAHPDRVRFLCARAEAYAPEDEDVFFFFNPFSEAVLKIALGRIRRAWAERPGRRRLVCYYPSDGFLRCLAGEVWLEPAGEIDCRNLFDGDDARERMVIWQTVE